MSRILNLTGISQRVPLEPENCRVVGRLVIAVDTSVEASFRLTEPTLHFKTRKVTYPDQLWTYVPAATCWLRNRDREIGDCTPDELIEVYAYIAISVQIGDRTGPGSLQGDVNQYITENGLWDRFLNMRSMNLHNPKRPRIRGIKPQFFARVSAMGVGHGSGHPLTHHEPY